MTGLPCFVSTAAYDASQGRDDAPDDRAEYEAVAGAVVTIRMAVKTLYGIETADVWFNDNVYAIADRIEREVALITGRMP